MALSLRRGAVTAVLERHEGLVRLEVDGAPCVAYPGLTGPVALGDDVLANTQARELGLGSGGFDVLYANLTRGLGLAAEPGAHVMKLPYTPVQAAVRHIEEMEGLDDSVLRGMPVVCCSLHSQVAPVCAALHRLRVAYIQLPGGALPLALSDTVRLLRERGLIGLTVSVGSCFGGDVESVTTWSALAHVRSRGYDVAICAIGTGIVGTASMYGHGGLAAAVAANAASSLDGRPVIVARVSDADPRTRHRGLSHHTQTILRLCLGQVQIANEADGKGWERSCASLPLSHMGRGPDRGPGVLRGRLRGRAARSAARLRGRVRPPMRVGVVTEIKADEYRVALTPAGARELVRNGHEVLVERGAGDGSAFADAAYEAVGARLATAAEVWGGSELVLKVKEPLPAEYPLLRDDLVLFTYLHLAASKELTDALVDERCRLRRLRDRRDRRRLAAPARADERDRRPARRPRPAPTSSRSRSAGAGSCSAAWPGVAPGKVLVVGGGIVGYNAAVIALGLGGERDDPRALDRPDAPPGRDPPRARQPRDVVDASGRGIDPATPTSSSAPC